MSCNILFNIFQKLTLDTPRQCWCCKQFVSKTLIGETSLSCSHQLFQALGKSQKNWRSIPQEDYSKEFLKQSFEWKLCSPCCLDTCKVSEWCNIILLINGEGHILQKVNCRQGVIKSNCHEGIKVSTIYGINPSSCTVLNVNMGVLIVQQYMVQLL